MIRLFVFDLDGTLVDSLRDLAESANALLTSYGAAPLDTAAIGGMVGDGAAKLVARACVAVGIAPPDALPKFLEIYDSGLLAHTRPYDVSMMFAESARSRRESTSVPSRSKANSLITRCTQRTTSASPTA